MNSHYILLLSTRVPHAIHLQLVAGCAFHAKAISDVIFGPKIDYMRCKLIHLILPSIQLENS